MTDVILCAASNLFRMYVIYRFMRVLLGECRASRVVEMSVYGGFYVINTAAFLLLHLSWVNILCNLIGFAVIAFLYTESVKAVFFVTCSVCAVGVACEMAIIQVFAGYKDGEMFNQIYFAISVFLTLISELLTEKIISGKKDIAGEQSVALALVPAVSIVVSILIASSYTDLRLVIISIGFFLINFLNFHLYERLSLALHQKYENEILKQKLQSYSSQIQVMMESEKRIKALRHDMKHHMNELRLMARQNKTAKIQSYIDAMQEFVLNPEEIVASGNWEIDSILNYMLRWAKQELRAVDAYVKLPEKLSHTFDLNVILGNLLENAIEGAKQTEEKWLKAHIAFQRGILQIEIENSFHGKLDREQERFLTTKPDKAAHGIGLDNVRKIVEKYNGLMEVRAEEGRFLVSIILYT